MAKGQSGSDDHAKVKLRVIEFELEGANASVENSIRQLTQALSVRAGAAPAKPALPARQAKELGTSEAAEPDAEEAAEPELLEPESGESNGVSKKAKPSRAISKPRVPSYIHDLGMAGIGDVTFKDFAEAKRPKNNNQRHLVIAFWLKEYGGSPTATPDKAYTCYRNVGWPTNLTDWDGNFRSQMQNNRFRRVKPGEYAINPVGEDEVRKMDETD